MLLEFIGRHLIERIGTVQYSTVQYDTVHGKFTSEGDQYLVWRAELILFCSSRLPEDGSLVPKHIGIR